MAYITIRIKGTVQVAKALAARGGDVRQAAAAALYAEANNIMTASKRLVPVDLGALKGSGYVTLPEINGNHIELEMGYGGPAKDYALIQHERTDFRHPDGGQAKYLQAAVEAHADKLMARIAGLTKAAVMAASPIVIPPRQHPTDPNQGTK